jgi:hypothetical protein
MSIKLSIIISVVVTLFLIFYYKQANKIFDKIFGIKRTDKKSKKIHYRNFIYIIPVMFLLFLDYTSGISNVKLLSEVGLYQIIPQPIVKYILQIIAGYGVVQVLAQDLGIKTGVIQRNFIQHPMSQLFLLWAGGFAITGTESQGLIIALIYLVLKYNVDNNNTSNVCFEDV